MILKEAGASPIKTHGGEGPTDLEGTIGGSVYKAGVRVEADSDRKVDVNLNNVL